MTFYSYIAFDLKVPDTAKKQIDRIRKEISSLDFMPSRYKIVDWEPWNSLKMHKVTVDKFVLYYTINEDVSTVTIIRIVYGGRNIEEIIKSENG